MGKANQRRELDVFREWMKLRALPTVDLVVFPSGWQNMSMV